MTNQLTFQETTLTPVLQDNQTWLTSTDLANALGYKDISSVTRIFNRNEDEFTACMTETVKLTVSNNLQKSIRIFSLRGCHLIAMFARTKIAKEFRKWVLDILDVETQNLTHSPDSLLHDFINSKKAGKYLLDISATGFNIKPYRTPRKSAVNVQAVMCVRSEINTMIRRMSQLNQRVAVLSGDQNASILDKPILDKPIV